MYPVGSLKKIKIVVDADVQNTSGLLRPPEGFEWIIYWLNCWHTMVAATAIYWYLRDKNDDNIAVTSASKATLARLFFYPMAETEVALPIKVTHDYYPYAVCPVVGGKLITIEGYVLERPENIELQMAEMVANFMGYKIPIKSRE